MMSLNQAHHPGTDGVILFLGERLLIFYDGCDFKLTQPLSNSCTGRVYLTSHRVIFISKSPKAGLRSFSMPFVRMKGVEVKQPVFGANRVTGKVSADPNGGWNGECSFSITFNKGGAIEFGKALLEVGRRASSQRHTFDTSPPGYPTGGPMQYYDCPPPAYTPPYSDPYYNFVPQHEAFGTPPANSLYHTGLPPPYPGAVPQPPYPSNGGPSMPNVQHFNNNQQAGGQGAWASPGAPNDAYYFRGDQHSVYAQPSAPPPAYSAVPPYPTGQPVPEQTDLQNKKMQ